VVAAGNDAALHCSGKMDEMVAVARAVPGLSERGLERLARAMGTARTDLPGMNFAQAITTRDTLLGQA
jgi:beta-N-acetylhexosaminidase